MKKFFDTMAKMVLDERMALVTLRLPPKDKSPLNMAAVLSQAASFNPKGFRTPGRKWQNITAVERKAIEAGIIKPPKQTRSPRGHKKLLKRYFVQEMVKLRRIYEEGIRAWEEALLFGTELPLSKPEWDYEKASRNAWVSVRERWETS